jgi:hypothetical protein
MERIKLGRVSHRIDTCLVGAGYDELMVAALRDEPIEYGPLCQWCKEPCGPCDILCSTCKDTVVCYAEMPARRDA